MEECPISSKSEGDNPLFIFIGEYVTPTEIHIHKSPTFYDALKLSSEQSFIKEQNSYQYLNFHLNKQIRFNYFDGIEKKSGNISLKEEKLQITMEQPLNSCITHLLIKEGKKLSYLTFPPNYKMKKKKDTNDHDT